MLQMGVMTAALSPHSTPVAARAVPRCRVAGVSGKLNIITTTFDWNDRYNLWSGLFGGMFLALAYFGTDQSQVQRYLAGKSIAEMAGLLFNAWRSRCVFILFIGYGHVFCIYRPPLLFERTTWRGPGAAAQQAAVDLRAKRDGQRRAPRRAESRRMRRHAARATTARRRTGSRRHAARALGPSRRPASAPRHERSSDLCHRYLPGIVGLVVPRSRAMSSIASEMNALVPSPSFISISATPPDAGTHYLRASRISTCCGGSMP
jgi:hypothetical protein